MNAELAPQLAPEEEVAEESILAQLFGEEFDHWQEQEVSVSENEAGDIEKNLQASEEALGEKKHLSLSERVVHVQEAARKYGFSHWVQRSGSLLATTFSGLLACGSGCFHIHSLASESLGMNTGFFPHSSHHHGDHAENSAHVSPKKTSESSSAPRTQQHERTSVNGWNWLPSFFPECDDSGIESLWLPSFTSIPFNELATRFLGVQ